MEHKNLAVLLSAHCYFNLPEKNDLDLVIETAVGDGVEVDGLTDLLFDYENDDDYKDDLKAVISNLGFEILSHSEAGYNLAKFYAKRIVEGEVAPYYGASRIWDIELKEEFDKEFKELRVFAGLASEYEDFDEDAQIDFYGKKKCEQLKKETEAKIIEEAKELLASLDP